jgi:predicted transcriptional regulator
MKGGRNVAHVKTAISLDESLFREAEEWAGKLGVSRSQFYAKAIEEYVRERENEELLKRLNEAHAGGLDPEDEELLERMRVYHGRLLEETGNEWKTGG